MPINGSNGRLQSVHDHSLHGIQDGVLKHIPVTWWPKTDSVSPQLGAGWKATDAPAEPPRAACRLAPASIRVSRSREH